MREKNAVKDFFSSSDGKFDTRRQASKYLNQHGFVYKAEQDVPLTFSKRTFVENTPTKKSENKKVRKDKK